MKHPLKRFWYVLAESSELTPNSVLSRTILDRSIACYRGSNGLPIAVADRCLHRCAPLSTGTVCGGKLTCSYHGWIYGESGKVLSIPSEGGESAAEERGLHAQEYFTQEQDGYIYVCLANQRPNYPPFQMPHYQCLGWRNIRLQNHFQSTLINCVENFIDIPHTAFVHSGIFRSQANRPIIAKITRRRGQVHVRYRNERDNLGSFSWLLNPRGDEIEHTDSFYMPNVTSVIYKLGSQWEYIITSQAVPKNDSETLVFTDITFRLGFWTRPARWIVRRQAQKVIDQDIRLLNNQMKCIQQYGNGFFDTQADSIHTFVSEIHETLLAGRDPCLLQEKEIEVEFWV